MSLESTEEIICHQEQVNCENQNLCESQSDENSKQTESNLQITLNGEEDNLNESETDIEVQSNDKIEIEVCGQVECIIKDTEESNGIKSEVLYVNQNTEECNRAEAQLNDKTIETTDKKEQDENTCSISIKFHNNDILDSYKSTILEFLTSFPEFKVKENGFILNVYKDTNAISTTYGKSPKRKKLSKAKKELFVVDATPSQDPSQTKLKYTTKFVLSTEKNTEEPTQNLKNCCFNCGEAHSLKDCLEPKDFSKINAARQKFKSLTKSSRYHLENQKYGHLQPGKISNELRKALGLRKNEAPHFIYLMRKLGYPPGWLEEAKLVQSNLDMFDIDGKHVKNTPSKKSGLDESKIIEYPGFNVPFENGIKDDYRIYKVPAYCEIFSKKAMLNFFESTFSQQEDSLEVCDMDTQDDSMSDVNGKTEEERDSPTLNDLELQKQQLLEQLNEEPKEKTSEKSVKATCFGTPVLKSNSPYSTLPDPNNFSKNVSPVINFENLPNSTGKYEQLSDVLHKVRNVLKNIHNT